MDEVFLAVPASDDNRKGTMIKNIRYLNISAWARQMADYKNALTLVFLDVQRDKQSDMRKGDIEPSEMPMDRRTV
jgi:hypothetical protein